MGEVLQIGDSVSVDGVKYPVKFITSPDRGLVDMGSGTLAVVVYTAEGWDWSPYPATLEETAFIEGQPDYGTTVVKVTEP
jgi:hypothetical protein